MRIYLPATLDDLAPTSPGLTPRRVHAVTAALRAALPDEDEEGLEFAAQLLAADDSLDLLARAPAAPRLRVVVSADVPDAVVEPVEDPGAAPSVVVLTTGVGRDEIACAHVDEPAARADVVAALAGDVDAIERLGDADLLWYDASELRSIPR